MEFNRRTDQAVPLGTRARRLSPAPPYHDKPVPPKNTAILDDWEDAEEGELSTCMGPLQTGWNER